MVLYCPGHVSPDSDKYTAGLKHDLKITCLITAILAAVR